jgi:phage gp29-like protein
MAVDSIAKNIAEVFNQYAIPRLLKLNGMDGTRCPYIAYGEVSHVDLTEISDFVTKLATAGVLMPDPKLEDYLRDLAGLPPAEHDGQEAYGAPAMPNAEGAPADQFAPAPLEDELDIPEGQEALDGDLE